MKKRILSFLMACFMVASTFIISKPLVHVHAVEGDSEVGQTYTLPEVFAAAPEGSTDAAVSGNWSVRVWNSIEDRTTLTVAASEFTADGWSVNVDGARFDEFDSNTKNDAKLALNPDKGKVTVIVFKAPESGVYYFEEDVIHSLLKTTVGSKDIGIDFLVFKGDYAYDSLYSSGPAPVGGKLDGYVSLKAGEELYFVAERVFSSSIPTAAWNDSCANEDVSGAYINDIVIKKVAELTEEMAETVYTADFFNEAGEVDNTIVSEGQFALAGYDYNTKQTTAIDSNPAVIPNNGNPKVEYKSNGSIVWTARKDMGLYATTGTAAVVFTAPVSGYYALYIDSYQGYLVKQGNYWNYYATDIVGSNGEILANSQTYASAPPSYSISMKTATNVFLTEGEEIVFVIRTVDYYAHSSAFKNVYAVHLGGFEDPSKNESRWELPMDWNETGTYEDINKWELAIKGQWRLTTFVDPADTSTIRDASSSKPITEKGAVAPESYIESRYNRGTLGSVVSKWLDWYFCTLYRWSGVHVFESGDNSTYINVTPVLNDTLNHPSVVFTAPEDGQYSYSSLVASALFEKDGKNVVINATIRKNGSVIDVFTPTAANPMETLEGTVSLKKGDMLAIVFTITSDAVLVAADAPIQLGETVVTKVGEYVEEPVVTTTWTLSKDFIGVQNSYFELKILDHKTGNMLNAEWRNENCVNYEGKPANYEWEVIVNNSAVFYVPTPGELDYTGGLKYVPVVEFTAPADGIYNFSAEMAKAYGGGRNELMTICKGNDLRAYDIPALSAKGYVGTDLLASFTATKASQTVKLFGSVELKAGETISFMRTIDPTCTDAGATGGALNYLTVSANIACPHDFTSSSGVCACGYACEHAEYADGNCVVCGVAHAEHDWSNEDGYCGTCGLSHDHEGGEAVCNKGAICTICGFEYTEVAADNHDWSDKTGVCGTCGAGCTHAWENGVCTVCDVVCEHDWTNGDGVCAICELGCTHDWSNKDGICATCGVECGRHDWSNKDGVCAKCGMTHNHVDSSIGTTCNDDGTHSDYCVECGYVYGSENCKPMEGNLCKCGYDCSAMIAEDNFDKVFDSIYNGGESEYVANGPAAGALDNVGAIKGADVEGFKYMGFNLEMSADKNTFYLRHHVLLNGEIAVKVGEADAALTLVSGNYYYFDVEVKIGEFGLTHTITADGTAVVTASAYSYMKTAFASGELTAEQDNLLKALYDWDFAAANANK